MIGSLIDPKQFSKISAGVRIKLILQYKEICQVKSLFYYFSLGNSCGMPWEYNQKVNNNNNEHLAQTTV